MLEIDGSARSGSGTMLRYAIALSSLLGMDVHITNIRAKRDKPGLRPQHLASVNACARMCGARVEGAAVDSREITYRPGKDIKGGSYQWDIGTAGSTTLLAMSLLPLAIFADGETTLRISGGLFQDFAPSAHHMQRVLFPTLRKIGVEVEMDIVRPGYVPRGGGVIHIKTKPAQVLTPLKRLKQGRVQEIAGIALSSHLKEQRVSERMAEECRKLLAEKGYQTKIETISDETALQAGAGLAIWAKTETGCLLGADQAGKRGRSSESIGKYVAHSLLSDLETGATVDRHLADQLVIYAALAQGTTEYVIPAMTDHADANLWLVEKFGALTAVEGNTLRITGMGYKGRVR